MKTTAIYGLKQPDMLKDLLDDVIAAVSTNAGISEAQFDGIHTNFNTQGVTTWGQEAMINFCATNNSNHQARIINYSDNQPWGNLFIEPQNYLVIRSLLSNATTNVPISATLYGSLTMTGALSVQGAKQRIVVTKDDEKISMNAYESPDALFTDYGRSKLINGEIKIDMDTTFLKTVNTKDCSYEVYLTKYGKGNIYVDFDNMTETSFIVKGDNDINFGYQIVAKQIGYEDVRFKEAEDNVIENAIEK